jgi:hypothetical protein
MNLLGPVGLTIAFFFMRLTHVTDRNWVWVFSPLIISAALTAIVLFVVSVVGVKTYKRTKHTYTHPNIWKDLHF